VKASKMFVEVGGRDWESCNDLAFQFLKLVRVSDLVGSLHSVSTHSSMTLLPSNFYLGLTFSVQSVHLLHGSQSLILAPLSPPFGLCGCLWVSLLDVYHSCSLLLYHVVQYRVCFGLTVGVKMFLQDWITL